MNKSQLVARVSERLGCSQQQAAGAVAATLAAIGDGLQAGEDVIVVGFGTFEVRERAARAGTDPRTKQAITIPARKAVTFRPSKHFTDRVTAAE